MPNLTYAPGPNTAPALWQDPGLQYCSCRNSCFPVLCRLSHMALFLTGNRWPVAYYSPSPNLDHDPSQTTKCMDIIGAEIGVYLWYSSPNQGLCADDHCVEPYRANWHSSARYCSRYLSNRPRDGRTWRASSTKLIGDFENTNGIRTTLHVGTLLIVDLSI